MINGIPSPNPNLLPASTLRGGGGLVRGRVRVRVRVRFRVRVRVRVRVRARVRVS